MLELEVSLKVQRLVVNKRLRKFCYVCLSSFESISFGNAMARGGVGGRDGTGAETGAQAGDDCMPTGARRNSFLYRSTDSITDISPMSMSRKVSAASGEVSVLRSCWTH